MKTLHWLTAAIIATAIVLTLPGALADGATSTTLTTVGIDAEETTFGDLTTDAISDAAGTTLAMAPAVVFKPGEIPPGTVTRTAIAQLLHDPAEKWAVLVLTGSQIRAALERSVSFAPTPRVFFLQVSGLTVVYSPSAPRGRKVQSISAGFEPLDDAASYEVAMPESLAAGGSGYFTIFGDADRVRTGTRGLADEIANYVTKRGSVSYTGQGRIVVGG